MEYGEVKKTLVCDGTGTEKHEKQETGDRGRKKREAQRISTIPKVVNPFPFPRKKKVVFFVTKKERRPRPLEPNYFATTRSESNGGVLRLSPRKPRKKKKKKEGVGDGDQYLLERKKF
ncbi:hypothetical protein TWF730_008576 [Orbilia blumenaviensis]|uniref:Uncharacterized protein n=1 Tax=Orbilia blumenaviensis TaxID=1796055 RepID=A0AAV9V6L1_9PEZI